MMVLNRHLFIIKRLLQNIRQFHCSYLKNGGSYEGSGKTMVKILNLDNSSKLINLCTPMGFMFNNNSAIIGPLAIFPRTVLCWNVASGKDINEGSLSLFLALEPKPDIVVLGLETLYKYNEILKMRKIFTDKDIMVEILPVEHACGVYNFLCEEGRYVVAGLIPPITNKHNLLKKLNANIHDVEKQKTIESS